MLGGHLGVSWCGHDIIMYIETLDVIIILYPSMHEQFKDISHTKGLSVLALLKSGIENSSLELES